MSDTTLQAALEQEHRQIDGGIEAFIAQPTNTAPLLRGHEEQIFQQNLCCFV